MKCENCGFLRCVSSETESYSYCPIFGDDVPYPFVNKEYDGCGMTFKEAKKLNELNDEAESLRYEHMGMSYELYEKEEITEEERKQFDKLGQELDYACKRYNNYFSIVKNRMKVKWNEWDHESIDEIKEFVRKRDEMLNKFNVNEFMKWCKEVNSELYNYMLFIHKGKNLEKQIKATMCELCLMSTGVTEEVKEKARKELKNRLCYEIREEE